MLQLLNGMEAKDSALASPERSWEAAGAVGTAGPHHLSRTLHLPKLYLKDALMQNGSFAPIWPHSAYVALFPASHFCEPMYINTSLKVQQ